MALSSAPHQPPLFIFRRCFQQSNRRPRAVFDALPLLDVILLLFLFLLMQSSFVLQPGIRVELPVAPFSDGTPFGELVVILSQEGMVFFNDERTTLEGLGAAFKQAVHEHGQNTLLVEADGRVRHEALITIYNTAREAGIREIILANRTPAPETWSGQ